MQALGLPAFQIIFVGLRAHSRIKTVISPSCLLLGERPSNPET
jgi:hypothetical protein